MVKVRTSKQGMVECGGKKYYFRADVVLVVPKECEEAFGDFVDGVDRLTDRERKLLFAAGLDTKEKILETEDLTQVTGIGEATADAIKEKLNGD